MSASTQPQMQVEKPAQTDSDVPGQPGAQRWSLASRVAFRMCFVYFGLFCLTTQILGGLFSIPLVDIPDLGSAWPMRQIVFWVAAHVFRITTPLVYSGSGSGDKTFDWILAFSLFLFGIVTTAVWSFLDRQRQEYVALAKWFRLVLRFALASEMLLYGLIKLIPLQMPYPSLARLIEPFGHFSPMGVLWSSVGASPAYEMFAGSAETLAGVLLIVPRTAILGALVCLADMTQVFTLNMTYDVPVKLFSFHLILMAAFLLAPELPRFANFFFLNRTVEPSSQPQLFAGVRANRIAVLAQIMFGLWLVGINLFGGWTSWHTFGGGAPKSPLYGIWNVEQLSIDGQTRAPLLTDYDRWRRVVFDSPTRITFQRMDDSQVRYTSLLRTSDKTLQLKGPDDKDWKATFHFERVGPSQLNLDGVMDGRRTQMQLTLVDQNRFLLRSRGFHWIQEYPFNR